jgi:tetratricopeptide (TPR) repeat protein
LNLVVALGHYWYERNHYYEGRLWTERAVNTEARVAVSTRGAALVQLGFFASISGEQASGGDLVNEGISLLRSGCDSASLAHALIWQGGTEIQAGEHIQAEQSLHEALQIASIIPNASVGAAISARCMSNLGLAAHVGGDFDSAIRWHRMALSTCREHGYVRGISRSLGDLADVARDQEDYITALKYYRECLTVLGDRSDIRSVIIALEGTAMAAAFWKQAEQATRLLGAAAGLGEVHKVPTFMSTDLSAHERTVRLVRMTIDETRFEELSTIGSRLTLEEAIAEALAFSPPVEVGSF